MPYPGGQRELGVLVSRLHGIELDMDWPVWECHLSIVTHGQDLNITVISYEDRLNFGFTACNKIARHIQRPVEYTGEALDELEACYN